MGFVKINATNWRMVKNNLHATLTATVDAASTFGDVEDPWNVHFGESPYGCE
jgi:hypothetical protein